MKKLLPFVGIILVFLILGCVQNEEAIIKDISKKISSYDAYSCKIFSKCDDCTGFLEASLSVDKIKNKSRIESEQTSGGKLISIFTGEANLVSNPADIAQKRYNKVILDKDQPVSLSDYSTIERIRELLEIMQEGEVNVKQQTANNFGPQGINAEMVILIPAEDASNHIKSFGQMMFYANTYLPAYIERGEIGQTFFYCEPAESIPNDMFEMPSDFKLDEIRNMDEDCTEDLDCNDMNDETIDTCEGYVNEEGYFSPGHCIYSFR